MERKGMPHKEVFSKGFDLGWTNTIKHRIQLMNETPFEEPCRRIPPYDFEDARNHIHELLDKEVFRESEYKVEYENINDKTVTEQVFVNNIISLTRAEEIQAAASCRRKGQHYWKMTLNLKGTQQMDANTKWMLCVVVSRVADVISMASVQWLQSHKTKQILQLKLPWRSHKIFNGLCKRYTDIF